MNAMDHGPFISSTIATDPFSTRSIIAHKGIAVDLGDDATLVFDTDLSRMAATWTGGQLHWYPGRDGLQEWPSPEGFMHARTSRRPGWSIDGKFGDPRPWKYCLIPDKLRHYHGMFLHGDRVVFSYRIGSAEILESPSFERVDITPVGVAAINAQANEFILAQEAERILAYSPLAYPGGVVLMEFDVPAEPGSYPYICTFSGHFTMMQGRLIEEP